MSSPIGPRRILHSRTFNDRTSLDAITEYTRNKLLDRERQYPSTYNTPTVASSFDGRGSGPASTADGGERSHSPAHEVHCCCGQKTCEARVKNISVLSELEENLQTAAQLGQALLRQADDAERIRSDMASKINRLEELNKQLEVQNTSSIEKNRDLLNSLETLNESVTQADSRLRDLTADLDDTRAELDRVSARAARAEILEAQLTVLETEQDDLRRNLSITLEDERNAAARWQKAERQVEDLQDEYNKLESEYMQEKIKTQKLANKIASRKSIRGLQFQADKMEGAAISNFMKEILQDNQQLQAGTTELRQMLMIAQDEIGALREQVLLTQRPEQNELGRSPLSYEFDGYRKLSQELHVHHHHHVLTSKEKGSIRRVKRRVKAPQARNPPSSSPLPPAWAAFEQTTPSKRSSAQTSAFGGHTRNSSVPNTVISETAPSTYRDSSIFDPSFNVDESRPTSAGSMGAGMPISPINVEKRRGHGRNHSSFNPPPFSVLSEEEFQDVHPPVESIGESVGDLSPAEESEPALQDSGDLPQFEIDSTPQNEEEEGEEEEGEDEEEEGDVPDAFELSMPSPFLATTIPGRRLVRSASHESLLAPETEPIDIFGTPKGEKAPISITSNSNAFNALQAVITPATAQNSPARYSSQTYTRLLLSSNAPKTPPTPPKPQRGVGSWFWNRFGSGSKAPESASSSLARHVEVTDDSSITTISDNGAEGSTKSAASSIKNIPVSPSKKFLKPPTSLMPRKSAPIVLATPVDEESLAEVLAE
ncbi:hypothetical protein TWF192_009249 [Orbilia oligospora]|uniref:Uncharacterized protein n=1 Tax=Orbilia oligospora TaxID=2813651 RepID=A0A6G1M1S9_ORBOL|nr:hypothetical protein TWF191_009713 [Orbilia oligospora]KAF3241249.1 hypothetical protein TWF192_009249 [Orbilia oligospora]